MGALLGAGKRLITGESLFMTVFTNQGAGKQQVAFAAPYPGKILAMDLKQLGGQLICQKDSFLCAARGVSIGIAFQRKIGVGLFGGEGFIMQRLEGDGLCFVHAGGTVHPVDLAAGQTLRVDTGCLVALQPSVSYDIQFVGKIKTALFGGEGLFFATLTGPGRVWLQSLPFSRMADRIYKAAPAARRQRARRKGRSSAASAACSTETTDGQGPDRGRTTPTTSTGPSPLPSRILIGCIAFVMFAGSAVRDGFDPQSLALAAAVASRVDGAWS